MTATTTNPYLRDAVLTATPEQLQLMLYDGAIRVRLSEADVAFSARVGDAHLGAVYVP